MTRRIDISSKTIFFITAFLLSLWVTYLVLDVILLLFVAFIFMSAISPSVERLVKWGTPKPIAITTIFLLVVAIFGSLLTVGLTPLINQTSNLSQKLAETVAQLTQSNLIDQSIINQEATNLSHQLVGYTVAAFENLVSFVTIIVMTFYLLLDKARFEERVASFFVRDEDKVRHLIRIIEDKLGAWMRGQMLLSVIIGIAVYIGLVGLGVEYALPLAIIAGLLEVVPVIGPIISAIPAILIGLTISPVLAVAVAGLYLVVQQLESHVVVPQVMKRAVGLNPLLVILAVTVGGRLLGVGGALLAVPIAVVIQVVAKEILNLDSI